MGGGRDEVRGEVATHLLLTMQQMLLAVRVIVNVQKRAFFRRSERRAHCQLRDFTDLNQDFVIHHLLLCIV